MPHMEVVGTADVETGSARAAPVGWVAGAAVGRPAPIPDASYLAWSRPHR
jgi:hypothetical protein